MIVAAMPAELTATLAELMAGQGAAGIGVIDVPALQARFTPVSATIPASPSSFQQSPLRCASPVDGSRSIYDSASDTIKVDTARLPLLLRERRLPTIAAIVAELHRACRPRRLPGSTTAGDPPSWNSPNAISDASSDT
jgi:hypothetical protein